MFLKLFGASIIETVDNTCMTNLFQSTIGIDAIYTISPSIKEGLIEFEVTISIGNAVSDVTDKKRVAISKKIDIKSKFPTNDFTVNFDLMHISLPFHLWERSA